MIYNLDLKCVLYLKTASFKSFINPLHYQIYMRTERIQLCLSDAPSTKPTSIKKNDATMSRTLKVRLASSKNTNKTAITFSTVHTLCDVTKSYIKNKTNSTIKLLRNTGELNAVTSPMPIIALNSLIEGSVRINRATAIITDFISSFGIAVLSTLLTFRFCCVCRVLPYECNTR